MDTAQKPSTGAIKLRIDTLLGRDSHLFTTTIFVLLGAIFLIASYAPEGYTTEYRSIMDCSQYAYTIQDYNCKPFDMATNPTIAVEVTDIGHRDKFLVLELSPLQMNSHSHIDITAQLTIGVYALDSQDKQGPKQGNLLTTVNKNVEFDCSYSQEEPCNTVEVYTIPKIEAKGYYFTVTFVNNNDISAQVSNFQVSTKTLNLSYRNYKFAVKFVFVAITALTLLAHFLKMSNLKKDFFTQEQKLIPFIAPSLLTINEPFTIHLFEGVMYSWATIFSFVVFSALLMWLWILVIDNLAGSDSSLIDKSSLFAKVYTPIYFVVLFITYGTLGHLALKDPMFNFHSTSNLSFNLFKYILFGVLIIGVLWMVKKSVSIYRRMNDLNERENAFYWFSVFFILSHFYFIATGGLFPFNYDLCGLLLFNGISTLYVFSSSYMFLPTQEGIEQANYLKKYQNPSVKNSYKDLEESVVHTQKNNNKETHQTDAHTEEKDKPLGQMQSQGVSLERNPAQIQYPYEQKAEEDF